MPSARKHRSIRILSIMAILILTTIALPACSNSRVGVNGGYDGKEASTTVADDRADTKRIADRNARALMARYDLHPAGEPKFHEPYIEWLRPFHYGDIFKTKLDLARDRSIDDHVFALWSDASLDIGIDTAGAKGKPFSALTYVLTERSQGQNGRISAYFRFDNTGRIRGANLALEDYAPGIVSLRDRYHFQPSNFKPEERSFGGITEISLAGPWGERDWEQMVLVNNSQEVSAIVKLLKESVVKKGDVPGPTLDDEWYAMWLRYDDGSSIRAVLVRGESADTLEYDKSPQWNYVPPAQLRDKIVALLVDDPDTIPVQIDDRLSAIMRNPTPDSNPYAFVRNSKDYDNLVGLGSAALPVIERKIVESEDSGLREYLLAIAAEDIAKVDLKGDDYRWSKGKEWPREWRKHLKSVPARVKRIVASGESNAVKVEEIIELGTPAIPFVLDEIEQGNTVIIPALDELLKGNKKVTFKPKEIKEPKQWVKANKAKFEDLRAMVEQAQD